jgi:hypothetical protein
MAKIYHDNGIVLGTSLRVPFALSSEHIQLDAHTNESALASVTSDPTAYLVVDGVLTRDGQPVAINPPCEDCATLDALDSATTVAQLRKALLLWRDKPGFTRG